MKKLNPTSRYEPRVEATMADLVSDAVFQAYAPRRERPNMSKLFLRGLGVDGAPRDGAVYVTPTPALLDIIQNHSIFGAVAATVGEEHSLELVKNIAGELKLLLRFEKISGSYCIALVDAGEAAQLLSSARAV